jgi:hypothetical protein
MYETLVIPTTVGPVSGAPVAGDNAVILNEFTIDVEEGVTYHVIYDYSVGTYGGSIPQMYFNLDVPVGSVGRFNDGMIDDWAHILSVKQLHAVFIAGDTGQLVTKVFNLTSTPSSWFTLRPFTVMRYREVT